MDSANYADLIFFAVLAAAIGYKLYTVLGRNDSGSGDSSSFTAQPPAEAPPVETQKTQNASSAPAPIKAPRALKAVPAPTPLKAVKKPAAPTPRAIPEPEIKDAAILAALGDIKAKDSSFTAGIFLSGARLAFELALKAFQEGDKAMLRNLLSAEVYKDFATEMDKRTAEGKFPQVTLAAISLAEIISAEVQKFKAVISVQFQSEQIHVVKDKDGAIIEGNPSDVHEIKDMWVFERDLRSTNPNWTITAT